MSGHQAKWICDLVEELRDQYLPNVPHESARQLALALARRGVADPDRIRRNERNSIAGWWDDTEARSAEAHDVYQHEAHRRGDVRHPDAYADLSEATKEWDRVLVRWVADTIRMFPVPP